MRLRLGLLVIPLLAVLANTPQGTGPDAVVLEPTLHLPSAAYALVSLQAELPQDTVLRIVSSRTLVNRPGFSGASVT